MRALISVYDKTGLDELARGLDVVGVDIVASGGTAARLDELGLDVQRVDELTDVPELLGGRVKTLHPRVHAGILARRDREDDLAALAEHEIEAFDIVCVNLYPFSSAPDVELIDVGGPAMLRAAAKNWAHVAAVSRPDQYGEVLAELREWGEVREETRRRLAADAFATTAAYDAAIARWLADDEVLPQRLTVSLGKERELAYGENPHQRAAYYVEAGARHLLAGVEQLQGKPLSFNNLNDLAGAVALLHELEGPAAVIVKHANPCGASVAASVTEAYEAALACDPVSAYGGVVALSQPLDEGLAARLAEQFLELVVAPQVDEAAGARLAERPSLRVLDGLPERCPGLDAKRVPGGVLVQESDVGSVARADMRVACGSPDDATWQDLLVSWTVCKHVTSNAIVLVRDGRTIGICGGQPSRVDAVRIALERAAARGHDVHGAVLASDAFFPFADGPQLALDAGVTALIQPGGSKRDAEVVNAVDGAGAAMVLTGRRHFRH